MTFAVGSDLDTPYPRPGPNAAFLVLFVAWLGPPSDSFPIGDITFVSHALPVIAAAPANSNLVVHLLQQNILHSIVME